MRALSHVACVGERRTTIPILSNLLLRTDDAALEIKGTDLEREVVERAPAQVDQPGATTVSAHLLYDIVRKLSDGTQIRLEAEGEQQRLLIECGNSSFFLPMLSAGDFPDLTAGELPHRFEVEARELRRLIEKTKFAISTEETRYYLTGIYFHSIDGEEGPQLRAVATDGHRLAQVETPMPDAMADLPGVIVPRKTVLELARLIEDRSAPVEVALSETRIQFVTGTVVMTSKLIDGTFPDYTRVIPHANDKHMVIAKQPFATAVDRVSTVSADRGRAVKLTLRDTSLTFSVFNPDGGSATEQMEVGYEGEPLEIGFNARYLLDIAQQIDGDSAEFRLADAGSPTIIQDVNDVSALYVLMPMRV